MKKQYMQPATLLTTVATHRALLAGSQLGISGSTNNTDDLLSRKNRNSDQIWDDDEEY